MKTLRKMAAAGLAASLALASMDAKETGKKDAGFFIHDGDRVVFYGDSITDTEWYPVLVESFVLTRYPKWRNYFSNRGVSGDSSNSIARFERDVISQKPDVCTYNMGFNDGGYFSFSPKLLEKYLGNVERSVALARQADPKMRMVLMSPIPNEVTISQDPRWVSRDVYPYAMLAFGAEEGKLAERLGLPFIDVGLLYGQTMGLGKVAAGETLQFSRDGIHPQRDGQTFIAYHVLRGLGADPLVASATIDAAQSKVAEAKRCTISDLTVKDGTVSFRRQTESLPCPIPPEVRPFAFLVRMEDNLNADLLKVTGLTAPAYTLFIDDQRIADLPASDLAQGVNLSRYPGTPMNAQALAVMDAVRARQVAECGFFRDWIWPKEPKADGNGVPNDKATDADRAAMDKARQAIADAGAAAYALNTPKPASFRLVPTDAKVGPFEFLAAADLARPRLDVLIDPVAVDWNRMTLDGNEIKVTIKNPDSAPRSGTINWTAAPGWTVTPAEMPFTVEAGKDAKLTFAASVANGAALVPPPQFNMTWNWSDLWPYPLTLSRAVQLAPRFTIPKAAAKPSLTGKLEDWKDAASFTLDQPYFINPALPGRKPLWHGPKDLSGRFFFKWDDTTLYVAALVRDDEHVQNASKMMAWSQDSLGLSFFAKAAEKGVPDARKEFFFVSYPDRDEVLTTVGAADDGAEKIAFTSKVSREDGTCLYEAAIPWSQIKPFAPAPGANFRFTLCVGEADTTPGKGFNYLAWTPGISCGKYTSDFGTIVLGDALPPKAP